MWVIDFIKAALYNSKILNLCITGSDKYKNQESLEAFKNEDTTGIKTPDIVSPILKKFGLELLYCPINFDNYCAIYCAKHEDLDLDYDAFKKMIDYLGGFSFYHFEALCDKKYGFLNINDLGDRHHARLVRPSKSGYYFVNLDGHCMVARGNLKDFKTVLNTLPLEVFAPIYSIFNTFYRGQPLEEKSFFLNRKEYIQYMSLYGDCPEDPEEIAIKMDEFKLFFFQPVKKMHITYGNDMKSAIKKECAIEFNLDKSKPFLTTKILEGSGWSTVVYYFQFMYDDDKILRKGTTDIYQAIRWLAFYKKNFTPSPGVPILKCKIGGKMIETKFISCDTALVATNGKVVDAVDYPMEMYAKSRIDILREEADFIVEKYTPEEIELHAKETKILDKKFKNKTKVLNLENIVTDLFFVNENIDSADQIANFIIKKFREQGIVNTSEIKWCNDLSQVICEKPISFLCHRSNNIEMKALQLRELSRGHVLLLFDLNQAWKYFELGSEKHIFHSLLLTTLLYDCIEVSPVMQYYLEKYKLHLQQNNKIVGLKLRLWILSKDEYDLNAFKIDHKGVWLRKNEDFSFETSIKRLKDRDLKISPFCDKNFRYAKYLYSQSMC